MVKSAPKHFPDIRSKYAHLALLGDSIIKRNITIGLVGGNCALLNVQCCLSCLSEIAKEKQKWGVCCISSNRLERALIRHGF